MRLLIRLLALAVASVAMIAPGSGVSAQNVAISPHLGTLGLGADVSYAVSPAVSVRGGFNFQPYSPEPEFSDVTFTLNLASPSVMGVVDLHPGGSAFRVSLGAIYFAGDLKLDAVLNQSVDIGDSTYTPADLGTLTGILTTNALAPYVGIGVGNAAGGSAGFFLDVGVALHGTPEVDLSASGPISNDPEFRAELAKETAEIQDDVESFKVYPVLSLGFRVAVR